MANPDNESSPRPDFEVIDQRLDKAFLSFGIGNIGKVREDGSLFTYYDAVLEHSISLKPLLPGITLEESLDLLLLFQNVSASETLLIKQDWRERFTV